MTPDFLLIALIVVATPGTGMIYTVAAGLTRGGRASLVAAFGCTLGILPHMIAAITGLAALLHASALLFDAVKYAGVAYLLWMAWQTWHDRGSLSLTGRGPQKTSFLQVTIEAVVINLLNPKLSIFFFAFLPQFISHDEPAVLARMLEMSGVFMAMTLVVFALYGLFAASVRDHVLSRPRVMQWMRRCFAAAFVALGAKLALTER
ncbi:MAG: LysE family translocator [Ferrovibrio sp.]|uniref:LysE family translocator n=1 Tax=Ferrovibrio sp. TaxID=1917215 RepID=UPI002604C730|nr:LysE family translocator [Ferrovibrio sp.]MCW0232942.1 LysE family translocator [Ferrovibrio sp.]